MNLHASNPIARTFHCLWSLTLIALASSLLAPLIQAQAEGQHIDQVVIDGLLTTPPEQLLSRLATQPGKTYNSADVRQDLTDLGRRMRTATVSTEPSPKGGVIVRFTVSEFPRLRQVQVVGNHKITTPRIETIAKLKAGDPLDENTLRSCKRALVKEYHDTGLPMAQITLNTIDVPSTATEPTKQPAPQADLQIVVDEGRQIQVDKVIVKGNHVFTTLRLKLFMQTKGSWGFVKNYYSEETFDDDLNRLRELYKSRGYFDARVERGLFEEHPTDHKTIVSPVVQIDEGTRYRMGDVDLRGVRLFGQAEALAPFKPLKGEWFDGPRFGEALKKLHDLYASHGLLTTQMTTEENRDSAQHVMNMTIDVQEKERIYVGRVRLEVPAYPDEKRGRIGRWYDRFAPPVSEKTVLREVLLKPGDVYNKRLERDTERRLARLGVFDDKTLHITNEPTGEPGVHDVVIKGEPAATGALTGGVGYGDVTGVFVFLSVSERNVGGEANVLNVSGMLGSKYSSATVSYLDRHLGDTDNSLLTRLYYQNLLPPGYTARVAGLSPELGHPLSPTWTVTLGGRLEAVKLSDRDDYHPEANVNQTYGVATGRLRLDQDTRYPIGLRPHEGYLQSVGTELGYAGGPLVKLEAMRDQYLPISERLTLRLAGSIGFMPYAASVVPIQERYFLGGNTDMRGFAYRGAGYFDPEDNRVPIGGAVKTLLKNELHFPLVDPISGVAFVDIGTLARDPVSWQAPRVSTGAGLRFDIARMQVALDLAAPIVKEDDDQTRYFHFSLQSQF